MKNELKYINEVQIQQRNNGMAMTRELKYRTMVLFEKKKSLIKEMLLLKSAFSMIDQMFRQEIKNAEIIKSRWFLSKCCRSNRLLDYNEAATYNDNIFYRCWNRMTCIRTINWPWKIKSIFLQELIDPFRVKEGKNMKNIF